jgi:hypothetical protein
MGIFFKLYLDLNGGMLFFSIRNNMIHIFFVNKMI